MADSKQEEQANEFDENAASHKMDLQSRTAAALGVDTMKNLSSLTVLIIGLRGVGVETAKNLILTGPKQVTVYDDAKAEMRDLGANFYLTPDDVAAGLTRSAACTKRLAELNPYCNVSALSGPDALKDDIVQSFGAVVVTQTLPQKELERLNQLCRTRKVGENAAPAVFILAVTHGVTGHVFSDFGASHVVTDRDGEPARALVIDDFTADGVITVAAKRHGFDDGDTVLLEDIEGADAGDGKESICALNNLAGVKVKRIYYQYDYKRADGKVEKREKQVFDKLRLDLTGTPLEGKEKLLSAWKTGGLINEVKPKLEMAFRPLSEALKVPATEGLAAFFGPQHPDQGAWEQGAGKTIHALYAAALRFQANKGHFPRLHDEEDAAGLMKEFRAVNEECKLEAPEDKQRINAYSFYFETELTGYCAFLGGIAAQEVVKKFGKYTPIQQWLHCDHIQLVGNEVPSDAGRSGSRYDDQISIFGKAFQRVLGEQNIFLVGTGALGCEYLKGLSLMGVACGPNGKVTCTDMDRIEISNLSRQFLFRARHVGKAKSVTAAMVAKEMNPSFNVEALEVMVKPETEDQFDDEFWDGLDLCWNALDNVHARKYTDNKCLLHSKPLLESGTMGTKCNSEVVLPYKTKSYNDGEEQETEGIPMCTLQNFPYLPVHCIEWARASFSRFETLPKLWNTFLLDEDKFVEQVNTAEGEERMAMLKNIEAFVNISANTYEACVELAFTEFVEQHVTRIKNLIFLFPEDETVKDKATGEVTGLFWTGHKKFPQVPALDLDDDLTSDYLYAQSQLWAFALNVAADALPKDKADFVAKAKAMNLALPEWKEPVGLKIKVEEDEEDDAEEEKGGDDKDEVMAELLKSLLASKKAKASALLPAMKETEFEKDDDANFHIDFITATANCRARNYRIKLTSRHQCKIIAGKIIAALMTTTAMICGLVELEFYKLKMGLNFVRQDAFYNANINLAVAQFQFFQPDAANKAEQKTVYDPVMCMEETHVPFPPAWTSWDSLVVDEGRSLSVGEFVEVFKAKFDGIAVELLHKAGKMEKGILLYNDAVHRKKEEVLKADLVAKYTEAYGALVSEKRNYVLLAGSFRTKNDEVAMLPRIKYYFK